jgi:hypothetical protein
VAAAPSARQTYGLNRPCSFRRGACWFEGVRYQACRACQTQADRAGRHRTATGTATSLAAGRSLDHELLVGIFHPHLACNPAGRHVECERIGHEQLPQLINHVLNRGHVTCAGGCVTRGINPKLLDLEHANPCHDLPKRRSRQDNVLATRPRPERRTGRPEKIAGDQRATTVDPAPGLSGYVLWPILRSLRRSPPICSQHADVTWD